MKTRLVKILAVAVALVLLAITLVALRRVQQARGFGAPHRVQTHGGTNYVFALRETTIGRTEAGLLLSVAIRLENPNPYELTFARNWFPLVDHTRNYYLPATTGTATPLIKLPAHGVDDRAVLTYRLDDTALTGLLAIQAGHRYWLPIKSAAPYNSPLAKDQFRSFRQRDW